MKIHKGAVSLSFFFSHPPEDEKKKANTQQGKCQLTGSRAVFCTIAGSMLSSNLYDARYNICMLFGARRIALGVAFVLGSLNEMR